MTRTLEFYKQLDWEKQDIILAGEIGVTRERVRQVRRILGRQNSKFHGCQLNSTWGAARLALQDYLRASGRVTLKQVCGIIMGLSATKDNLAMTSTICQQIGFATRRTKRGGNGWRERWQVNFDLPNIDLESVWGLSSNLPANERARNKLGKSCWDGQNPHRCEDPTYQEALRQEHLKARQRFLT